MELFDNGAERAVLSGLMQYGSEVYVEICDILEPQSFGSIGNQVIYRCFSDILDNQKKIDFPSILSSAEKLNLTESISTDQEIEYIKSLKDFHVEKDNVFAFAAQIKKYEFARDIKKSLKNTVKKIESMTGEESIEDIVSYVEEPVEHFIQQESFGQNPSIIGNDIDEWLNFLEENQCDFVGVPTGFNRYDESIGGGLRRKCVDVVGARPKTGKSLFADAVAINVTNKNIPVLMLDTEMDSESHRARILASMTGVKIRDIETGKFALDEEQKELVYEAANKLKDLPYHYLNISGKPVDEVLNIIKRWTMHVVKQDENGKTNDCLVVYDYLKLMSSNDMSKNAQEYQILGFHITALHNLCVKLDVPCLTFVQLNRDGISKEGEDAISGSDRIAWLCTSFTIFKKKSEEEVAEDGPSKGNRKLIPILSRYGGGLSDGDYINMEISGDIARLGELKTRNELLSDRQGLINDEALEEIGENENGPSETKKDSS